MNLAEEQRKEIITKQLKNSPSANKYLQFIVEELKPFIDNKYSTLSNKDHTIIMGSSMGAIISLYAMCKYPLVFGKVACISTHWPVLSATVFNLTKTLNVADEFREFVGQEIQLYNNSILYFDHGTKALDSLYAPYQIKVDKLFNEKGFTTKNFNSNVFSGEDHSEKSWSKRLNIPLEIFLQKEN